MLTIKRAVAVILIFSAASALLLGWWFFGEGLSEQTAYKLSLEKAEKLAARDGIDLSMYSSPEVGSQQGYRLYTFTWRAKDNLGSPLTIVVDAMTTDVTVIQSWEDEKGAAVPRMR